MMQKFENISSPNYMDIFIAPRTTAKSAENNTSARNKLMGEVRMTVQKSTQTRVVGIIR